MKTQIRTSLRPFLTAVFGLAVTLSLLNIGLGETALAAPARCFTGNEAVLKEATCDPNNSRHQYLDTAGNRVTALPDDTCYQQDMSVSQGAVRYRQGVCAELELKVIGAIVALCENSGGTWNGAAFSCECPAGSSYSSTARQCQQSVPTTETECTQRGGTWRTVGTAGGGVEYGGYCQLNTPTGGSPTGGEPLEQAESNLDCQDTGGDLTAENCGIVGLLNTIFNFVSGGVALAVIANIIVAGIQYSMAQGDPGAAAKSKTRIRNALIAFLMYVSLYGFIQWLIPGGVF